MKGKLEVNFYANPTIFDYILHLSHAVVYFFWDYSALFVKYYFEICALENRRSPARNIKRTW